MQGYKGFSPDLICRDAQYSEHTVFTVDDYVVPCQSGLHFCRSPLDVIDFYPLINADGRLNAMATVESRGDVHELGTKLCTSSLYVNERLTLYEMVYSAFEYTLRNVGRSALDRMRISIDSSYAKIVTMTSAVRVSASSEYAVIFAYSDYGHIATSGNNTSILSVGSRTNIINSGECSQIVTDGSRVRVSSCGDYTTIYAVGDDAEIISSGIADKVIVEGKNTTVGLFGDGAIFKAVEGTIIDAKGIGRLVIDGKKYSSDKFYTIDQGKVVEWERRLYE